MKKVYHAMALFAVATLWGCVSDENFEGVNSSDYVKYSSFNPGRVLLDNNGRAVNAHGAGFLFANGRYYMFGEHKLGGTLGNKSLVGVHCYSSEDLYNWRDEGIALAMSDDPESPVIKGTILERPKVVYNKKTGKYVMFMHLEERFGKTRKSTKVEDIFKEKPSYRAAKVAIAVSDNVVGPYKFVRSLRPNAGKLPFNDAGKLKAVKTLLDTNYYDWKKTRIHSSYQEKVKGHAFWYTFEDGQMSRDMTVFIDDDKKAYLFSTSECSATIHIHELTDDYLDFTGRYFRTLHDGHHEAPAVFKKDDKYFMFSSHCTGWSPNAGRLSCSDKIFGEWREVGNPCRGAGQKANATYSQATADTTFRSQSTYVIPVQGKKDAFIYVGDRWKPDDAIDGRYVFLPVEWENGMPIIKWYDEWDLSIFDK